MRKIISSGTIVFLERKGKKKDLLSTIELPCCLCRSCWKVMRNIENGKLKRLPPHCPSSRGSPEPSKARWWQQEDHPHQVAAGNGQRSQAGGPEPSISIRPPWQGGRCGDCLGIGLGALWLSLWGLLWLQERDCKLLPPCVAAGRQAKLEFRAPPGASGPRQ